MYVPDYIKLSTNPDVLRTGGQRINDNFDTIAYEIEAAIDGRAYQNPVITITSIAPTSGITIGSRYIVDFGVLESDPWYGHIDEIAELTNDDPYEWEFLVPEAGWCLTVLDEEMEYLYNDEQWNQTPTLVSHNLLANIDGSTYHVSSDVYDALTGTGTPSDENLFVTQDTLGTEISTHDHSGETSTTISYGDLDDVPSSFPPSSHTHSKTDVTDFAHTHSKTDVTDFSHAASHITALGDEIDGDKLDVDFNPSYYTPATVTETDDIDDLSSHLHGIDLAINGKSDTGHTHAYASDNHDATHISEGGDEIDGDKLDVDWDATNYTPTVVTNFSDSVDHLTSHLKGIDTAIGGKAASSHSHSESDITDLQNYLLGDNVLLEQITTPESVVEGYTQIYAKSDGKVYRMGHDGEEEEIGTGGGSVVDGTAGENLAAYDVVYGSSGSYYKAQSDNTEVEADAVGIVTEALGITSAAIGEITLGGLVTNAGWSWSPGAQLYLSGAYGGISETEPTTVGDYVKPLGFAVSATQIFFNPQAGWVVGELGDHATSHLTGQSDELDGDKLNIDFEPSNYTPTLVTETTSTDDLSSHLKGIDIKLEELSHIDTSSIENTLIQMAWDVYSEDRAFDDIYADDLTDQTGIDTVNSTGTYNSGSSYYSPTAAATGTTTDYTSSQLNTTNWSDINSVAITQTTPGDVTASAIYYAVSFDGGTNYKVYKSSAWTIVAKNNSGTWQYNNAGTLTNASTNSLAGAMAQSTAQSAYQWTKTNIEAMTDANWEESGGWSTSVNTIDWTYRLVDGVAYIADGSTNSSTTDYINSAMSSNNAPSPYVVSCSSERGDYPAWWAFNRDNSNFWVSSDSVSGGAVSIMIDLGTAKVVNKYAYKARSSSIDQSPTAWKLQGSNNTGVTANSDNYWSDIDTRSGISLPGINNASAWFTFTNATAYRYYRMRVTACGSGAAVSLTELWLISAQTTAATPTYTKTTFNHDTEHVALDLRTNGWEASANDPTDGYVVLDVEPVDAITNNTDIKTYISIDNGSNYEQVTLESTPFREIGDHDYIRGDISGITSRTDKTIRFKVTSHNSKNFKLHGLGGGVKY